MRSYRKDAEGKDGTGDQERQYGYLGLETEDEKGC